MAEPDALAVMSDNKNKKFILIDSKLFDIAWVSKKMNSLKISKNGHDFRISILLDKNEVRWLIEILSDFYWNKGG